VRECEPVTLIAAEMARVFSPPVPLAGPVSTTSGASSNLVTAENDPPRLEATAADIARRGQPLRPALDAKARRAHRRGAGRPRDTSHAAQPPYRALAGELLDAVDRLEAVFKEKDGR